MGRGCRVGEDELRGLRDIRLAHQSICDNLIFQLLRQLCDEQVCLGGQPAVEYLKVRCDLLVHAPVFVCWLEWLRG